LFLLFFGYVTETGARVGAYLPGGQRLTAGTKEQAELLRARMVQESQHASIVVVHDRDIKIDAYADRWLDQVATSLEPRTLASYRQILRIHVRPVFGDMKVRAIHRGHIKALLAKKRGDGLSKNSVRLIRATISVMLGDAVDDGILQTNPAAGLRRRGRRSPDSISPADRQEKIKVFTYEQLATFELTARSRCSQKSAVLFELMVDAGLRPGEVSAARWDDFDPVHSTMRVERAVEDTGRVKALKTHESRMVDLTPRLASALLRLQASLEAEALMSGEKGGISPWAFVTRAGTPPTPHRVAKVFKRVLREARLPLQFSVYCLRHTFASHLIATGAPITYIAAQLGHKKVTTTLTYYAHLFPNGDRRYVEQMERVRSAVSPGPAPAAHDDGGLPIPDENEDLNTGSWHHFGSKQRSGTPDAPEVPDLDGGPSRTRTLDPLIKSQLLYQLS
jgi:integrase